MNFHNDTECWRKKGLCLICGLKNHMTNACPDRDPSYQQGPCPKRTINFASLQAKEDGLTARIQEVLEGLNEEDYEKVVKHFSAGFP